MFRTSFVYFLFAVFFSSAVGQQPGPASAPNPEPQGKSPTCIFSELFRSDGWNVPGLEGAKVKRARSKVTNIPGLFLTMLEPADPEVDLTEMNCDQQHPGRVNVRENAPIKVLDLWAFDFGGQVFAYRLSYAGEAIYDGKREDLAWATSIFFYDLDGSGRFTVIRYPTFKGKPDFTTYLPEFIPDWVKNNQPAN